RLAHRPADGDASFLVAARGLGVARGIGGTRELRQIGEDLARIAELTVDLERRSQGLERRRRLTNRDARASERAQGVRRLGPAGLAARALGGRLREARRLDGMARVELGLRAHIEDGRRVLAARLRAAALGFEGEDG